MKALNLPSNQYGHWLPVLKPEDRDAVIRLLNQKLSELKKDLGENSITSVDWIYHNTDSPTIGWKLIHKGTLVNEPIK